MNVAEPAADCPARRAKIPAASGEATLVPPMMSSVPVPVSRPGMTPVLPAAAVVDRDAGRPGRGREREVGHVAPPVGGLGPIPSW